MRPDALPAPEEGHLAGVPPQRRAHAPQDEHLRRRPPHPSRHGLRHPQVLQRQGLRLSAHPAHHRIRRGGRRRHVPGHHDGPQEHPAGQEGQRGFLQGLLRQEDEPHRERPARGRARRHRRGRDLHLRPHLPGGELQHPAPPRGVLDDRAGNGLLRHQRRHGARRRVREIPRPVRPGPLHGRPAVPQRQV